MTFSTTISGARALGGRIALAAVLVAGGVAAAPRLGATPAAQAAYPATSTKPDWRGADLSNTGRIAATGPATTPAQVFNAKPVSFGSTYGIELDGAGNVIFSTGTAQVYSYTPAGVQNWAAILGTTNGSDVSGPPSFPVVSADGNVYMGADNGNLYQINVGTGAFSAIFGLPAGGLTQTPKIGADNTIYIGGSDGNLYHLSTTAGAPPLYTFAASGSTQTSGPAAGLTSVAPFKFYGEVALDGAGNAYAASTDTNPQSGFLGTIYKVSPTGSLVWKMPLQAASVGAVVLAANPAVPGQTLVIVADRAPEVNAFDAATGAVVWTFTPTDINPIAASPALSPDGRTVYINNNQDALYALNTATGTLQTGFNGTGSVPIGANDSPVVDAAGNVFLESSTGALQGYSPAGAQLWTIPGGGLTGQSGTSSPNYSSPAIDATGVIYVGGNKALVRGFQAASVATSTSTAVPTATSTNTPVPISTNTSTPVPTSTTTAVPTNTSIPTTTSTTTPVPTNTSTVAPDTSTPTSTVVPNTSTATSSSTTVSTATPTSVATDTPTNSPVTTPTGTSTAVAATATASGTASPTVTSTPPPATDTPTMTSVVVTSTPQPSTATATLTVAPATSTPTSTLVAAPTSTSTDTALPATITPTPVSATGTPTVAETTTSTAVASTATVTSVPQTGTPTVGPTDSPTATLTVTMSATPTAPEATATAAVTATNTSMAVGTSTQTPAATPTAGGSTPTVIVVTLTPTTTSAGTPTPMPSASTSATGGATATPVGPTATVTSSPTQTALPTQQTTATTTPAPTPTEGLPSATATATATPVEVRIHVHPRGVVKTPPRLKACRFAANLDELQRGCEVVSSTSAPRAGLVYTVRYGNGLTQRFTDRADARGHSLQVFNIAYVPPAGTPVLSPRTLVRVTVRATSPRGVLLGSESTTFRVVRPRDR